MAQRRARPDRGDALFIGGSVNRHPPSFADPEEAWPRPLHPGNPPGNLGQRPIALPLILEPAVENVDRMHMPMPFANQLGAGLQSDGGTGSSPAPLARGFEQRP